jgi:hypothetical protein
MRRSRLAVVAAVLASACGPDEIEPLLTCEPGPVFQATITSCELVVDGNGGPGAALLWTIEAEDETAWRSYELASDGGVFVFADDELTAIVARLGPSGEFRWSRSLVVDAGVPDGAATAEIEASAAGSAGLDVVVQRRSDDYKRPYDAATLVHLSETGECGNPVALAFGGVSHGNVENMVREPDRLVLTGSHTETGYSRSFVQRRSLAGELIVETEIDEPYYDDVEYPSVQVGGPERYVVSYSGYAPVGISGSYSSAQLFDESLTSIDRSGGNYVSDAFGRLYTTSSNATEGDRLTTPPTEPQPPTIYSVTRSQTPVAPAGETLELEVPQPQCGWPKLAVFDESLLVLKCYRPDSPTLLLAYDGSGPPDSTATLACADADLALGPVRFSEDRRLWMGVRPAAAKYLVSVEF